MDDCRATINISSASIEIYSRDANLFLQLCEYIKNFKYKEEENG